MTSLAKSTVDTNPFDDTIVSDAWSCPLADVPDVHKEVYEACTQLLKESSAQKKPKSLLVHGSAGSGKTHLLARLRATVTDADDGPIFCYVRLSTAPNMIRRHLRRRLVNDLVRRDADGASQLDHILISCLDKQAGIAAAPPRASLPARLQALRAETGRWGAAKAAFQEIAERLQIDFNLARACGFWLSRRRRAEVVEWLATGDLPDDLRSAMGLTSRSEDNFDELPEQIAGEFINSLLRLICDTRPLVLCFDQIEALQTSLGDPSGFYALGHMVTELFDQGRQTVIITCAQSMLLPEIKTSIPKAFFHRLAENEKVLAGLTEAQARDLVRSRLAAWGPSTNKSYGDIDSLRPLSEESLGHFMASGDRTPRRLFGLCRDALPRAGQRTQSAQTLLLQEFETRREAALDVIPDAHGTFVYGLSQLVSAKGRRRAITPKDRRDVDMVLAPTDASSPQPSLVIGVCNQKHNALTARLRRIREESPVKGEERIVVREASRPIPRTAVRAREHWDAICRRDADQTAARARPLLISAEALSALEAIRSIVADSRAGDLANEGETVPPQTVEAWIRDNLLDESLEQLLAELEHGDSQAKTTTAADPILRDNALEVVQARRVISLSELASVLGCTESQLIEVVGANDAVFGVLGSPPKVVFERVIKPLMEASYAD
jgi:hypothetical protein